MLLCSAYTHTAWCEREGGGAAGGWFLLTQRKRASNPTRAALPSCMLVLCYAMLCHAVLCYAVLCHAMLCHAMLCYAMLCHAMLCYAMLCYAMLWSCEHLYKGPCASDNTHALQPLLHPLNSTMCCKTQLMMYPTWRAKQVG